MPQVSIASVAKQSLIVAPDGIIASVATLSELLFPPMPAGAGR